MQGKIDKNSEEYLVSSLLLELNKLSDREKTIMQERFALCGRFPKTRKLVGEMFGVSSGRIRQIEQKILYRLYMTLFD